MRTEETCFFFQGSGNQATKYEPKAAKYLCLEYLIACGGCWNHEFNRKNLKNNWKKTTPFISTAYHIIIDQITKFKRAKYLGVGKGAGEGDNEGEEKYIKKKNKILAPNESYNLKKPRHCNDN